MAYFGHFFLDKEKDIIITLDMTDRHLTWVLRTPNHATGNLITNLAASCGLPLSVGENGLKEIRGEVPCYIDAENRSVYILHLGSTKVANISPDGRIERKATIPAISKILMSQAKSAPMHPFKALVKTYILRETKFRTDLHTHMNANLDPDTLMALGIFHQIRYPLYYIKKLGLCVSPAQQRQLEEDRALSAARFAGSGLKGKYLDRRIDDNTFINFADLILHSPKLAAWNIPRIRASLAVLKDGQAVFTNLEKVYLYRYVFTRGVPDSRPIRLEGIDAVPDEDIASALRQMMADREDPRYAANTLFQNKLLWIARNCRRHGVDYMEISDTSLLKAELAPSRLAQIHAIMPAVTAETGVTLRFLAAFRRIPLTIVKDQIPAADYLQENLRVFRAIAADPYVAGCDIVGEEINDIRQLQPLIRELVRTAREEPSIVIRIHAGENDCLRDNVANSIHCVLDALAPGQPVPRLRIGHGLYTADLRSPKGRQLMQEIRDNQVVLEFQITSNIRLNNLNTLHRHPLKQYLEAGILCVQGTDGGALYGTDSIDEQLALERLLELRPEELLAMRWAEEAVLQDSLKVFDDKQKSFALLPGTNDLVSFWQERIARSPACPLALQAGEMRRDSREIFSHAILPLPEDRVPVILMGGSFNSDQRISRLRPQDRRLIDALLTQTDPDKVFFVVGHHLTGAERYLCEKAVGRFPVYAFVPSAVTEEEAQRLTRAGLSIRVSIEPSGLAVYKSITYEIFKRRPALLIALDGNSAGANMMQDARNARRRSRIYVSLHSRALCTKARALQGYVTLFDAEEAVPAMLADIESILP